MNKYYKAFTLAETLIALVVIGIIAVITIPIISIKKEKENTCIKLKKFYSIMTQAVNLYAYEEGINPTKLVLPEEAVLNGEEGLKWYNNTIGKHISSISAKVIAPSRWQVFLNDGTSFTAYFYDKTKIYFFYCVKASCNKHGISSDFDGKRSFLFSIYNKGFMSSTIMSDNKNRNELIANCANGTKYDCTRLIQTDGWQIADDYPW